MSKAGKSCAYRRPPVGLGAFLFALAGLAGAGPALAQGLPAVQVYHSPSETGEDLRSATCPPGCDCSGGAGVGMLIDFDELGLDVDIEAANPYEGQPAFSSPGGDAVYTFNSTEIPGFSEPRMIAPCYLVPGEGGSEECDSIGGALGVDFATPVRNLSFWAMSIDAGGTHLYIRVHQEGWEAYETVTARVFYTGQLVDLSAFSDVDKIVVGWEQPGRVFFDNFSFEAPVVQCVIHGTANEELELWIDGGPAASGDEEVCMLGEGGGSGDELCGADILLQLSGVGEFWRFVPDAGMSTLVYKPDCVYDYEAELCLLPPGTTQLRLNFLSGLVTPGIGPRRIGSLFVNSTQLNESTPTSVTAFGEAAGANLQARPIASAADPEVVAVSSVPEPGAMLQLASGLLGLGFLYRLRRRS
jgi:hypothetical protein